MTIQTKHFPVTVYDDEHDVLHVYNNDRCTEWYSSAVEIEDGVYRLIDDETGAINGYKILDWHKKVQKNEQERSTFFSDSKGDIRYVYPSQI